jgi:hypothetical protein
MKIIFAIILILVALVAGALWYFDSAERYESHFNTYEELAKSEMIGKGWVPEFIPKSAYDIYEKHRVDVRKVNVKFRFRPGEITPVEQACSRHGSEKPGIALYKCNHASAIVIVKLTEDGRGEIHSE